MRQDRLSFSTASAAISATVVIARAVRPRFCVTSSCTSQSCHVTVSDCRRVVRASGGGRCAHTRFASSPQAVKMLLHRAIRSAPLLARSRALSTQARSVLTSLDLPTSGEPIPGVLYSHNKGWCGSGPLQKSHNPATGEVLAEVRTASSDDVEDALKATRTAYEAWRWVPGPKRGEVLRQIRGALNDRIDDLGALVTLEMGKIASGASSFR